MEQTIDPLTKPGCAKTLLCDNLTPKLVAKAGNLLLHHHCPLSRYMILVVFLKLSEHSRVRQEGLCSSPISGCLVPMLTLCLWILLGCWRRKTHHSNIDCVLDSLRWSWHGCDFNACLSSQALHLFSRLFKFWP